MFNSGPCELSSLKKNVSIEEDSHIEFLETKTGTEKLVEFITIK